MLMSVVSLPFTGFCYQDRNCWPGWSILLFGALGLAAGPQVSWLANLLVIPAWLLLLARSKTSDSLAAMLCVAAIVVGNSFLLQGVSTSKSGGPLHPVSSLGIGYWLWMVSITLSMATAVYGALKSSVS